MLVPERYEITLSPKFPSSNFLPVQTIPRVAGAVRRELIFFTTDRPHCILKCPHFLGTITAEWFWLCVRSLCHHIWRMRTFDENSSALSITNPRSLSPPNFAPEPINCRGGEGRSLIERSDYRIGGGYPETRRGTSPATRGIVWMGSTTTDKTYINIFPLLYPFHIAKCAVTPHWTPLSIHPLCCCYTPVCFHTECRISAFWRVRFKKRSKIEQKDIITPIHCLAFPSALFGAPFHIDNRTVADCGFWLEYASKTPLEVVADLPHRMRLFWLRCQIMRLWSVHIKPHYSQNAFDSALLAWYERGIRLWKDKESKCPRSIKRCNCPLGIDMHLGHTVRNKGEVQ